MANQNPAREGPMGTCGTPSLCVEMGFYADISLESRCNIEINIWTPFYKILSVFKVPYRPRVKGMPGKSKNYHNLVKDATNTLIESFLWNRLAWGQQEY